MFLDPFYFSHFGSLFIGNVKCESFGGVLNCSLRESRHAAVERGAVLPLGCDSVWLQSCDGGGLPVCPGSE